MTDERESVCENIRVAVRERARRMLTGELAPREGVHEIAALWSGSGGCRDELWDELKPFYATDDLWEDSELRRNGELPAELTETYERDALSAARNYLGADGTA